MLMLNFDWMKSIGATDQAVAALNSDPRLFTILIGVIVSLIAESLFVWYIHYATLKPEQRKKKQKGKKSKESGAK